MPPLSVGDEDAGVVAAACAIRATVAQWADRARIAAALRWMSRAAPDADNYALDWRRIDACVMDWTRAGAESCKFDNVAAPILCPGGVFHPSPYAPSVTCLTDGPGDASEVLLWFKGTARAQSELQRLLALI